VPFSNPATVLFGRTAGADNMERGRQMLRQETVSSREVILIVSGPLAGPAVEEFVQKMDDLCSGRFVRVTLDLAQCPSVNSAVLGKLLFYRRKLEESGGALQVAGCSDGIYRVFMAIRFEKLISIRR
jgi:anti-anti-sigma regulatory factor